MGDLIFASSNEQKFHEAKRILDKFGIGLRFKNCDVDEIQTTDVPHLIRQKCLSAYDFIARPLIVEHTTLQCESFGGFPAGLTSVFLKTVGLPGACELLGRPGRNKATAKTTIAYTDGKSISLYEGDMKGEILEFPSIAKTEWQKFGWNAIFRPEGYCEALAEIGLDEKNEISMRKKALESLVASGVLTK